MDVPVLAVLMTDEHGFVRGEVQGLQGAAPLRAHVLMVRALLPAPGEAEGVDRALGLAARGFDSGLGLELGVMIGGPGHELRRPVRIIGAQVEGLDEGDALAGLRLLVVGVVGERPGKGASALGDLGHHSP